MELKKKNAPASVPVRELSIDEAIQEWLTGAGSIKTPELFFEMAKNFVCVLGTDGRLKKISRTFINASGYSSNELASAPFADFVVRQDPAKNNHSRLYYFETHFCCRNNRIMKVRWRVVPDICGENVFMTGWEIA
jgi:hypothetical protein